MDRKRVANNTPNTVGNIAHNISLSVKVVPQFLSFGFQIFYFISHSLELSAKSGLPVLTVFHSQT
jgi:hypothetical protein